MADTILRGGRVVDPATGFEGVADVLIREGRIAAIGTDLAADADVVDVAGALVGPGFVDLHSHVHSIAGQRLQALDGVTTALDLELGLLPVARAYERAAQAGRPLHYGFAASWTDARAQVLIGAVPDASPAFPVLGNPEWQRTSTSAELESWLALLESEIAAGALGIGVLMGYAPHSDPAEFRAVARLAARAGVPVYSHVRELVEADPLVPIDGVDELVAAAAETGAAMHHCHVNSTSRRQIDRVLATLERSRAAGARVTVETYPYGAGSTAIGAYFLQPERLPVWGLQPSNIVLVRTGERIADEHRLREVRASDPGQLCVVEFLDERDAADRAMLHRSLAFSDSIVASDAMPLVWPDGSTECRDWPLPPGAATHPRTAGTFMRSLRLMVRELGEWTWLEAFRRCSYLPARVLDDVAPAAQAKGHLGVGADADIVVLDADAVTDNATYVEACRPSSGVQHLLVGGEMVVRDGALLPDALPGRPLRGEPG
jgi:cytosine/adenosine deaminase-related metal-dependent hydrolase